MIAALLIASVEFFSAVRANDKAAVEKLLETDPSLASAKDEKGSSAVSVALSLSSGEGFTPARKNAVLQAILARHPSLSAWETAALGSADEVRAVLAANPKFVAERAKVGWTPLHYAAFADNAAAAAVLLDAGADVNARAQNKFDNTPLQVSMLTGSSGVAKVLLARGADVNAKQAEGITALHEAAQAGDVASIRLLLAAGADRAAAAGKFGTPLDLARKGKHDAAAKLLTSR